MRDRAKQLPELGFPRTFYGSKNYGSKNQSTSDSQLTFWLILSLLVPLYFGLISLHHALSQPYIVQDDARIHIIGLQQFVDSQLFPDDLFVQYYQSIQSIGFKKLYWFVAQLGIEPVLLAKLLPTALGLLTTLYCFKLVWQLLPIPSGAFLASLILNQNLWLKDDLISATPRSFAYLFFVAFLYYLVRRSLLPGLVVFALQGLFYPQLLLVEVGVLCLRLFRWQGRSLQLTHDRSNYYFAVFGLLIAAMITIGFSANVSQEFGPLATLDQMKAMPELGLNGRREYFGVDPISFWFRGASGLRLPLFPPIIWFSIGLPFLLSSTAPIAKFVTQEIKILAQVLFVSLVLFAFAHLLFPKLYLPSRYTFYSFRVVMSIAAGIVLIAVLNRGYRWLESKQQLNQNLNQNLNLRSRVLIGVCGLFAAAVLIVPAIPAIFLDCQNWIVGETPELYQFFAQRPKDSLIASFAEETNNLPAFAQRSVLFSRELALPYHPVFYDQVKQRMVDLLRAQYSPTLSTTKTILQNYGIDFLILESQSFEPNYLLEQDWLIHSSIRDAVSETVAQLKQGITPALMQQIDRCSVFSKSNLIVLDAACINGVESD